MAEEPRSEQAGAGFTLRACKIDRSQLDRILALAAKDIENPLVTLSTVRKGSGITSKITGETIDELLEKVKHSTMSGNPDQIDNLSATFFKTIGTNKQQYVFVHINDPDSVYDNIVSVNVSGPGSRMGCRSDESAQRPLRGNPSLVCKVSTQGLSRALLVATGSVGSCIASMASGFVCCGSFAPGCGSGWARCRTSYVSGRLDVFACSKASWTDEDRTVCSFNADSSIS
jgi:hypothetical protein